MADPDIPGSKRPRRRRLAIVLVLLVCVPGVMFLRHLLLPRNFAGRGERLRLDLAGTPFDILYYGGKKAPKGIVVLGTGDGGWSYWEENTAKHLAERGYAVAGWDCRKFADTRQFDQPKLVTGFMAAWKAVVARSGASEKAPVWYGGWSTGAEQAAAAAATMERPPNLTGLLLAAPGERGRYGIITSDLLLLTPRGPGSFAMTDLAPKLAGLRVAQFAAGLDPLDHHEWLQSLATPHKLIELPGKLHDMGGAGPDFQKALDDAMTWTLSPDP